VAQIDVLVKELPKFNLKIGPKQSQKILEDLGLIFSTWLNKKPFKGIF
jgi:hypothetical protein